MFPIVLALSPVLSASSSVLIVSTSRLFHVNPRLGDLFEFAAAVSTTNCIAPSVGRQRLENYFRALSNPQQCRHS
jgi:hypothetical protein